MNSVLEILRRFITWKTNIDVCQQITTNKNIIATLDTYRQPNCTV